VYRELRTLATAKLAHEKPGGDRAFDARSSVDVRGQQSTSPFTSPGGFTSVHFLPLARNIYSVSFLVSFPSFRDARHVRLLTTVSLPSREYRRSSLKCWAVVPWMSGSPPRPSYRWMECVRNGQAKCDVPNGSAAPTGRS
jgi:hypothetical protein